MATTTKNDRGFLGQHLTETGLIRWDTSLLNPPVSHMRSRKRNPRTPGAAANDASAVIDSVEPVIEVHLERLSIALGRVARVLPMKCTPRLLAGGVAFQAILVAGVLAFAQL